MTHPHAPHAARPVRRPRPGPAAPPAPIDRTPTAEEINAISREISSEGGWAPPVIQTTTTETTP
ncbi:hypothetical protein [Synechococcus sp. CBW1107]|uniref:hypothetical protein n=1 Tax=Synechococcus sp. CBW1107 TaxID=2789857 RepID=UPI002AD32F72|nr:hypothetical protein [Synechococcus sp. CBW1107]CAK6692515.1 hypothetical protein ICNINCKA_01228 [Synechococcus sp. CBW1107]